MTLEENSPTLNDSFRTMSMMDNTTMDNTTADDGMRTPTMRSINVADIYDWKHRASTAEQELSFEKAQNTREKQQTRRLQSQIHKSAKGWRICTQQCKVLANSNYALSHEVQRLKATVETLEHVIQRLFVSPQGRDVNARTLSSYETVDD